uniref:Uncharacterized protein n=1 Tax=Opuntia streptacantha TaxID=393608 RepID=A0A7C9AU72_OPUST
MDCNLFFWVYLLETRSFLASFFRVLIILSAMKEDMTLGLTFLLTLALSLAIVLTLVREVEDSLCFNSSLSCVILLNNVKFLTTVYLAKIIFLAVRGAHFCVFFMI